jgi:predicted dehydrogenase
LPGFGHCPGAKVTALCDSDPKVLEKAGQSSGIAARHSDYRELLKREDVQAVVVATPNVMHAPIVLAAVAAGKHVLCEKPISMNFQEGLEMWRAAEKAGVRHMTAFTYRFVPAMRYIAHLVKSGAIGRPYHFRANRFQDWGDRNLGWRQVKKLAATGEMGDMLSHRIDFGHHLIGPMARLAGRTRRLIDQRGGMPADVEDWVAVLADFESGASGVLESTKLATGRGEGAKSRDYCEVNGSEGTVVYLLERPNQIEIGKKGDAGLKTVDVPEELLKYPGSTRDPRQGDPTWIFRYDQDAEFINAIREGRECSPSLRDGVRVAAVMDAVLESERAGQWVDVRQPEEMEGDEGKTFEHRFTAEAVR